MKHLINLLFLLLLSGASMGQSFSLALQPSGGSGIDANVKSSTPTTNYGSDATITFSRSTSGVKGRSLLEFDLTAIDPGMDIMSAQLILYGVAHTTVNSGTGVLQLVPSTWGKNSVNWNISTTLQSADMPSVSIASPSTTTQNYTLDVTSMVQTLVNSPLINFGWMFYMQNETAINNKTFSFGSSDNSNPALAPKLVITYCKHMELTAHMSVATSTADANGGVYLEVDGGIPPFTYSWSTGVTTKDLYNVGPGIYTVTVTDTRSLTGTKIIPISGNCGNMTYTLSYAPGNFSNAKLINSSFNTNKSNTSDQNLTDLVAQNEPDVSGIAVVRSLFAFDLTDLPADMVVSQATLQLTNSEVPQDSAVKIQLCRVVGSWDDRTATYNNQPVYNDSLGDRVEFSYDGTLSTYTVDITAQLQKMISQSNSSLGWMLKLKNEAPDAAGMSARFINPRVSVTLIPSSYGCSDTQLNWNQEDVYDENGNIISSQKTYLDNMGRVTQKLVKDGNGDVFRTQTVYDSYGYAAVNSMPAYSGNQLKYQTNFMNNVLGQAFSYTDFDTPTTLNANTTLQYGIQNSLGNYYSDGNSYDLFQATTGNPYSRTETTGGGVRTRVSQPGNAYKMGGGHESFTYNIVSGDELKYIFGTSGSNYYSYKAAVSSTSALSNSALTVTVPIQASKQIVVTPDNPDLITYSVGDKVIATCYAGLSTSGETYTNMTAVTNTMMYSGTQCVDIHLPYNDRNSLSLPLPAAVLSHTASYPVLANINYTITDLSTDKMLVANTDYTIGSTKTVSFSTAYLNQNLNKSLFLRINYGYSPAYAAALFTLFIAPPDVQVNYHLSYGRASKNYYDLGGKLRKSVSPKDFDITSPVTPTTSSTYDYSHRGELIGSQTPDQGKTELVYDTEGKLRFSQNAVQRASNYFSYVNYDQHGRVVETGENQTTGTSGASVWFYNYYGQSNYGGTGISSTSILDQQDGLLVTEKNYTTVTSYTAPGSSDDIPSGYSYRSYYRSFRNGQVNFVKNANNITWYTYDSLDRPLASIVQVTEPDFVAKNSSVNAQIKTSQSTYNYYNGLSLSNTYQLNNSNESLAYTYSYTANQQPSLTALSYGGTTYTLATASYNKMGQLKRKVLGKNFQGLDYVYLLNGNLKAINHSGLDATLDPGGDAGDYSGSGSGVNKDLFGEILDYYQDDYLRTGSNIISSIGSAQSIYDGLLHTQRFKTQNVVNSYTTGANYINYPSSTATLITSTNYKQQELSFQYLYDEFNQLGESVFMSYNNSTNVFTQYVDYEEGGPTGTYIGYDRNGNIKRLVRAAYNGTTLDDLTYTISVSGNQVTNILDAASNSFASTVNFKTPSTSSPSSFGYNAIGQMTISLAENISSITYFPNGKIKLITFSNSNTTEYAYGAMGQKLKSKYYNATTGKYKYTWYVGPYVYEFDEAGANAFAIKEAKMSEGVIRVSSGANISSGYLVYQISDHLGNVRVSFTQKQGTNVTGTGIEFLSYNDYYAFGGQLPGRSSNAQIYNYGFQGQEIGQNGTIWDQFDLRNYNHDLGRWFTPDPYGQFASPYVAMGNNPVSNTDPNGGYTKFGTYGTWSYGGIRDAEDRANHIGQYSSENAQKRYNADLQSLVDHFLVRSDDNEHGYRDATKFLEAVKDLNDWYHNLKDNGPIGAGTGSDYLSQSEITLNAPLMANVAFSALSQTQQQMQLVKPETAIYGDMSANNVQAAAMSHQEDHNTTSAFTFMDMGLMNGSGSHELTPPAPPTGDDANQEANIAGNNSDQDARTLVASVGNELNFNSKNESVNEEEEPSLNENGGNMTFPAFSTLWDNYPHDINGEHQHPSSDPYPNQCAIRVGSAFIDSGIDMSSYPEINKTSEGYPRSSKNLADWTWQNFGKPIIMSLSDFQSNYSNRTGLIFENANPGYTSHIDLWNAGQAGSGFYTYSYKEIWFWPIK